MHKVKRFFETLLSKKGCFNCLYYGEIRKGEFGCSLPEKDRLECERCDKTHEPYSKWEKKISSKESNN